MVTEWPERKHPPPPDVVDRPQWEQRRLLLIVAWVVLELDITPEWAL